MTIARKPNDGTESLAESRDCMAADVDSRVKRFVASIKGERQSSAAWSDTYRLGDHALGLFGSFQRAGCIWAAARFAVTSAIGANAWVEQPDRMVGSQ